MAVASGLSTGGSAGGYEGMLTIWKEVERITFRPNLGIPLRSKKFQDHIVIMNRAGTRPESSWLSLISVLVGYHSAFVDLKCIKFQSWEIQQITL